MSVFARGAAAFTHKNIISFCGRYKHFLWALIVPVFITAFLLNEKYNMPKTYYSSYIPLDDHIPLIPQFILAYYAWFPLLAFIGLVHLFSDSAAYKRYIWALMTGLFAILIFYLIFPNGQDLRIPIERLPDNIFGKMLGDLWRFDSNTGVIPSMHVFACIIMEISVIDSRYMRRLAIIIPVTIVNCVVAVATVFIKQHSLLDVFASFIPGFAVYILVYIVVKKRQSASVKTRALTKGGI